MSIKLRKAARLADTGKYPCTWYALLDCLPVCVVDACTAKQLAVLVDAIREQQAAQYIAGYAAGQGATQDGVLSA